MVPRSVVYIPWLFTVKWKIKSGQTPSHANSCRQFSLLSREADPVLIETVFYFHIITTKLHVSFKVLVVISHRNFLNWNNNCCIGDSNGFCYFLGQTQLKEWSLITSVPLSSQTCGFFKLNTVKSGHVELGCAVPPARIVAWKLQEANLLKLYYRCNFLVSA